jgi:GntR family transcriptional regulator
MFSAAIVPLFLGADKTCLRFDIFIEEMYNCIKQLVQSLGDRMKLKVDLHSRVPIYIQIVEWVKHSLAIGELAPGEQLPTVRQLAHDLRVNFNTVARAYSLLNDAGILSTQQGRGTYVRERPDGRALSQMRSEKLRTLVNHAVVEALSLGYGPAEIRNAIDDAIKRIEKETKH